MDIGQRPRLGTVVFLSALVIRGLGVAVTTHTTLNPYARVDADQFAQSATEVARTVSSGQLPTIPANPNDVITLWGIVVSPLWLLPGPSRLYGQLFVACCGAVAVYALYRLGRTLHSPTAGVVACLPVMLYPSYVLVHSTVLRESFVLAGILGATYLLVATPEELSWVGHAQRRYPLVVLALVAASVVRWENVVVYGFALGGGLLGVSRRLPRGRVAGLLTTGVALVGAWLSRPLLRDGLAFLATRRDRRSMGRTVYLPQFRPDTVPKALLFAPVGAVYFLFTPFPWMVETVADAVVFGEALGNLVAAGLATVGVRTLWHRSKPVTATLVASFLLGVVLYGLVNANVGTNVRQRQMFLWVLFLFAGISVAERIDDSELTAWRR